MPSPAGVSRARACDSICQELRHRREQEPGPGPSRDSRNETGSKTRWQHEPEIHLGSPVREQGRGRSQGSWSEQLRPVSADSVLAEFTVDAVIGSALLGKMNLLVLSFPLKLHPHIHWKEKELWKCTLKRCMRLSSVFLFGGVVSQYEPVERFCFCVVVVLGGTFVSW